VQALIETLGFRHIGVVKEQYAVDKTGMKISPRRRNLWVHERVFTGLLTPASGA